LNVTIREALAAMAAANTWRSFAWFLASDRKFSHPSTSDAGKALCTSSLQYSGPRKRFSVKVWIRRERKAGLESC
jgi:hypothetical protein